MKTKNNPRSLSEQWAPERGMTLVEIVVSLLLAGIAFTAIASALTTGLATLRASRETEIAVQAAQQEMENMRNMPIGGIDSHSFSVPALKTNGTVVVDTESTATNDIQKKVTVNVSWTSKTRDMNVNLVTYMTENGINGQ
ncbi:MAG: prepilin-type N-terminal cleavage/methylation domain-containing protein [bacterium]|jgi:prepilin-type N-terminal cleavage/methylation domain-containing protein